MRSVTVTYWLKSRLSPIFSKPEEEADVRNGVRHPLAVEFQHQVQRGMRRRVLRPEIHRPQVRLPAALGLVVGKFG